MPINLSRLGTSQAAPLTVPRDIFDALPSKPWPRLRLEQGEVLKSWYDRRTQRDIVIKQNTGGGKTLTGLLVAKSCVNEGAGPAAYLTPDTFLAAQVINEATKLGISVVEDPRDHRFSSCQSILVTTFEKMLNGRTSFGVSGTGRPLIPVGSIVVDDAHAALALATKQFKIRIPASHDAYFKLRALFADSLKRQSPSWWAKIQDCDQAGPLRNGLALSLRHAGVNALLGDRLWG